MAEHFIKATARDGIWLTGTIDDFPFGIKVCDKKSGFGIRHGRVIKLYVNDKNSSLNCSRMSAAGKGSHTHRFSRVS